MIGIDTTRWFIAAVRSLRSTHVAEPLHPANVDFRSARRNFGVMRGV